MVERPLELATTAMLAEARLAREGLTFGVPRHLGRVPGATIEDHYNNYGLLIKNRMISLYDDCILLLDKDRIPSACVIARCIMETYAVGEFSMHEVVRAFNNGGLEKASNTILKFVNSSRVKLEEQERLKKGIFSIKDFQFTEEAKNRMENEMAVSVHILNAMRHLYGKELAATGEKESKLELIYSGLCEWTHPSQTSLFHAFVPATQEIPTSAGVVNLFDGARFACANAMHFLSAVPELLTNISLIARDLGSASNKK